MVIGARFNSSKKICGTCGSWSGARELDASNTFAIIKGKGKCLNRKGKYNIEISDENSCNAWSKWGPLK